MILVNSTGDHASAGHVVALAALPQPVPSTSPAQLWTCSNEHPSVRWQLDRSADDAGLLAIAPGYRSG